MGQVSCSAQCDTAAGYSAGTVTISCNSATKTWNLPPSGTCSKPTGAVRAVLLSCATQD
jgi:hypothetical protein